MGTVLRLPERNGPDWQGKVVGKMFGKGGNADLIGIIVEATDDGERYSFGWPLVQGSQVLSPQEVSW